MRHAFTQRLQKAHILFFLLVKALLLWTQVSIYQSCVLSTNVLRGYFTMSTIGCWTGGYA